MSLIVVPYYNLLLCSCENWRTAVAQWLGLTCYKSEGRWFDPRWCHWNFSLAKNPSDHTMALGSTQPLTEMSTTNISWG